MNVYSDALRDQLRRASVTPCCSYAGRTLSIRLRGLLAGTVDNACWEGSSIYIWLLW